MQEKLQSIAWSDHEVWMWLLLEVAQIEIFNIFKYVTTKHP